MTKKISAAEAKARFAHMVSEVEHTGERIIIERHGKAVAALVSLKDVARLERETEDSLKVQGPLSLVGTWDDALSDEDVDAFIADIYEQRKKDLPRPFSLEE